MRLIDADDRRLRAELWTYTRATGIDEAPFENATKAIDNAPTIDAVEVVRCKDCKWWGGNKNTEHNNHICNRALKQDVDYWTRADDFCSYGEREESEVEE